MPSTNKKTASQNVAVSKTVSTDKEYSILFKDLCRLYESTLVHSNEKKEHSLRAYWQMGKRILDVVERKKTTGGYQKQVIANLSEQLTEKYGDGLGKRTVQHLHKFSSTYTPKQLNPELSWSHYRALLSVTDPTRRTALEQRAIDEHLTKKALEKLIRHLKAPKPNNPTTFPLYPRTASPGIYKIVDDPTSTPSSNAQTNHLHLVDLGFNVKRLIPLPGVPFPVLPPKEGTYVTRLSAKKYTPITIQPGERYCYLGTVLEIIDGDTVKMRIQLGFNTVIDERLRLRGVDAMEIETPEGQSAKRALSRLLRRAKTIHIFTYSNDKYGRYIADLITDEHIYINKKLVESGHARFQGMGSIPL